MRDNTSNSNEIVSRRISTDFGTSITPAVIRDILTEDEVIMLEEEIRNSSEPQQLVLILFKILFEIRNYISFQARDSNRKSGHFAGV